MEELAPGLHRWTVRHPAWEPGAESGSPADWPPDVGSVAYEAPDALVLVDPLVADWAPLDALVPGDRLLGDDAGGLTLCPESWLGYIDRSAPPDHAVLRAALAPLLELDVELVLTSHGEPVLRDGAAAVRAALA